MGYNPNSTGAKSALSGSTSGTFTQFASAITASYSLTWPAANGSMGDILGTDGAGNLVWTAGGGVTSLNSLTGTLNLVAGSGISITPSGSNITITATSSSSYLVNTITLTPTDITNKFVTLSAAPTSPTKTVMTVIGGPMQSYGADYTVSGSQLGWNGLFLDGLLVSGDMLVVEFN